jgi:hypothetical protein
MRGPVGSAVDDRIVAESMRVLGPSTWFKNKAADRFTTPYDTQCFSQGCTQP